MNNNKKCKGEYNRNYNRKKMTITHFYLFNEETKTKTSKPQSHNIKTASQHDSSLFYHYNI